MDKVPGPKSIGVIMDGNRRWAKEHGLPTLEGHRKGLEKIYEVASWAQEAGIGEVVMYAFSTENWNRSPEEVGYLMDLFTEAFGEQLPKLREKGVRLRFIGDRSRASDELQRIMKGAEIETSGGTEGTLIVAFSYGGRAEILAAVNALLSEGAKEVDESAFAEAMWSAGMHDPDIVIRTGGDRRLSNFLPWQTVYSELFFIDTKWPSFSKEEFFGIISDFSSRERRRGR